MATKLLYGNRMRRGQRLTVEECKRVQDDPETWIGTEEPAEARYKGVTLLGECLGCGFKIGWQWGCPNCRSNP
jgi:hypothetical protein